MSDTKFYAADLHIHTPTSSCYRGPKNDDEYIEILKRYHKKNIKIIAITDHNTINGYKKIVSIKEGINKKIKMMQELLEEYPALDKEIEKQRENKKFFDEMLILPGVEFEANPGIHLLFIFDPKQDLNDIDDLLTSSGYTDDIQGAENAGIISVSVEEALNKAKNLNALTIGAHVDSSKGIYNDLKGSYRAMIFKSNDLDGISVNNTVTINKIQNLLQQAEYKREKPLAMIQSSDHHHEDDCGKHITYFNLNELSFSSIRECFKAPIENISATERPEVKNIIKKIANEKSTHCIEKFSEDEIYKTISGILNNKYGNILIGVTNDDYKNIKGIQYSSEQFKQVLHNLEKNIAPGKIYYSVEFTNYDFGNKKVVDIKVVNNSNKMFSYDSKYYSFDKYSLSELDTFKVNDERNKQINDLNRKFHTTIDEKVKNIITELELLSNTKNSHDILTKINNDSILLYKVLKLNFEYDVHPSKIDLKNVNGDAEGRYFYVNQSVNRHSDFYVRCSCPVTEDVNEENKNNTIRKGLALIIVSGGGSYIINQDEWELINFDNNHPALIVTINEEFKEMICEYTVLAWFKSSLCLWMLNFEFDTLDMYKPKCFKNMKIPSILFKSDYQTIIKENIEKIIDLEKKYLSASFINEEEFNHLTAKHNRDVDVLALEIDEIIYSALELNEDDKNLINDFLHFKDLYDLECFIDED